ncbi:unnamed protein product, partial [Dovyalis caffra]
SAKSLEPIIIDEPPNFFDSVKKKKKVSFEGVELGPVRKGEKSKKKGLLNSNESLKVRLKVRHLKKGCMKRKAWFEKK